MLSPTASSSVRLDLLKFMGQMIAIAIRSRITLDLSFPSALWKCVVRQELCEDDIASFDQDAADFVSQLGALWKRLQRLQRAVDGMDARAHGETASADARDMGHTTLHAMNMNMRMQMDVDEEGEEVDVVVALAAARAEADAVLMDVSWSATRTDGQLVELMPGGADRRVLVDELGAFVKAYTRARLTESFAATEALREGILSVIPQAAISLMNWNELRDIVCGSRTVDIARLKANTEYDDDVDPSEPHIGFFWEALTAFSEDERSTFLKVSLESRGPRVWTPRNTPNTPEFSPRPSLPSPTPLQFVWARPTLPPSGMEFPQKMKVQSAVGEDVSLKPDDYLPKAHTCFFSINLPRYSSLHLMTTKVPCVCPSKSSAP